MAVVKPRVNVNTTLAIILPHRNTRTLHDPIQDTEHARARSVEDGVGVGASVAVGGLMLVTSLVDGRGDVSEQAP